MGDNLGESSHPSGDRLGQILVRRNKIRSYQLDFILLLQSNQKKRHRKVMRLGDLLVKHRVSTPLTVTEALAFQEAMPKKSVTDIVKELFGSSKKSESTNSHTPSTFFLSEEDLTRVRTTTEDEVTRKSISEPKSKTQLLRLKEST